MVYSYYRPKASKPASAFNFRHGGATDVAEPKDDGVHGSSSAGGLGIGLATRFNRPERPAHLKLNSRVVQLSTLLLFASLLMMITAIISDDQYGDTELWSRQQAGTRLVSIMYADFIFLAVPGVLGLFMWWRRHTVNSMFMLVFGLFVAAIFVLMVWTTAVAIKTMSDVFDSNSEFSSQRGIFLWVILFVLTIDVILLMYILGIVRYWRVMEEDSATAPQRTSHQETVSPDVAAAAAAAMTGDSKPKKSTKKKKKKSKEKDEKAAPDVEQGGGTGAGAPVPLPPPDLSTQARNRLAPIPGAATTPLGSATMPVSKPLPPVAAEPPAKPEPVPVLTPELFEEFWSEMPDSGSFECGVSATPDKVQLIKHLAERGFETVASGIVDGMLKVYFYATGRSLEAAGYGSASVEAATVFLAEFRFMETQGKLFAKFKCSVDTSTATFVRRFRLQKLFNVTESTSGAGAAAAPPPGAPPPGPPPPAVTSASVASPTATEGSPAVV